MDHSEQNSPNKPTQLKVVVAKDPVLLKELLQPSNSTSRPIITILKAEDGSDSDVDVCTDNDVSANVKSKTVEKVEEDDNLEDVEEPTPQSSPTTIKPKEDDKAQLIKEKTEKPTLRRSSSAGSTSSNEASKPITSPVPKRRKVEKPPPTVIGKQNDVFCWVCHKDPTTLFCAACKRAYHQRCAGEAECPSDWVCPECTTILHAENMDSRSKTLSDISMEKFCTLLKNCVSKLKCSSPAAFHQPVPVEYYKSYLDFVIHPMDLSLIEKKIKQKLYGCTEAFLADVKWIVHNTAVFNGAAHTLTVIARKLVRIAEADMAEIEVCPDCFVNLSKKSTSKYWFSEVCGKPHPIVWAKLKGFPYWPAKVVKVSGDSVDARFFGAHDRAWVPISQCYHLSKEMPTVSKPKKKQAYDVALEELTMHVKFLKQKYGKFDYAPYRTPFNPDNKIYTFHGMDTDHTSNKTDVCNGNSKSGKDQSSQFIKAQSSHRHDKSPEVQLKQTEGHSTSITSFASGSSYVNGSKLDNDSDGENSDIDVVLTDEITILKAPVSRKKEPELIMLDNDIENVAKNEQDDHEENDDLKIEEEKPVNSQISLDMRDIDWTITNNLTEMDDVELEEHKEIEAENGRTSNSESDPLTDRPASPRVSQLNLGSAKVESFEIKNPVLDNTAATNSNIENLKKLESALEELLNNGDSQNLQEIKVPENLFENEKVCSTSENGGVFDKVTEGKHSLNPSENKEDLQISENLASENEKTDNLRNDESTNRSDKHDQNDDQKVDVPLPSTKLDFFALKLGKTIESCKAKLGITELCDEDTSSCSDSAEEDESEESENEESDNVEDEESENEDSASLDEESSAVSSDEEEQDSDLELSNKKNSATDTLPNEEKIETAIDEKKDDSCPSPMLGNLHEPEIVEEPKKTEENFTEIEKQIQDVASSSDIKNDVKCEMNESEENKDSMVNSNKSEPGSVTTGLELSTPVKTPASTDQSSHPEVYAEDAKPVVMDNVDMPSKSSTSKNVIDIIDLSSSEDEMDDAASSSKMSQQQPTSSDQVRDKDNVVDSMLVDLSTKDSSDVDDLSVDVKQANIPLTSFKNCLRKNSVTVKSNITSGYTKSTETMDNSPSNEAIPFSSESVVSANSQLVNVTEALATVSDVTGKESTPLMEDHTFQSPMKPMGIRTPSLEETANSNSFHFVGKNTDTPFRSKKDPLNAEESINADRGSVEDIKVLDENFLDKDGVCSKETLAKIVSTVFNKLMPTPAEPPKEMSAAKNITPEAIAIEKPDVQNGAGVKESQSAEIQITPPDDIEKLKIEVQDFKEQLRLMKMKYEKQQLYHHQDMLELRHNMNIIITEMRASLETDKKDAIETLQQKLEAEKIKAVEDTKGKQWCACCKSDAIFLCCWNNSYCSHACQKQHWPQHRNDCPQAKVVQLPPKSSAEFIKIAKKPLPSEVMETSSKDKKVILVNLKQDAKTSTAAIDTWRSNPPPEIASKPVQIMTPKFQLVTAKTGLQSISTPTTSATQNTNLNSALQILFAPASSQPTALIQDSADIITKVRSRQTDLTTAIQLLNKMNKETEAATLRKREADDNSIGISFAQLNASDRTLSPRVAESVSSQETDQKAETDDLSDDVLIIDEKDDNEEMVKLNYGVEISKAKLSNCKKMGSNATRLARSLVDVLFPDQKVLAESCVFGRKSNVTKQTRPALNFEIVNAIIDYVISVFPSALKTDLVLAMNLKCKEARIAMGKANSDAGTSRPPKQKAEMPHPESKRRTWMKDKMEDAIRAVQAGEMGLLRAHKKFGVPKSTLQRFMKMVKESPNAKISEVVQQPLGRKITFSEDVEKELADECLNADSNPNLTRKDIQRLAYQYANASKIANSFSAKKQSAGRKWMDNFMKRNPHVSSLIPKVKTSLDDDDDDDIALLADDEEPFADDDSACEGSPAKLLKLSSESASSSTDKPLSSSVSATIVPRVKSSPPKSVTPSSIKTVIPVQAISTSPKKNNSPISNTANLRVIGPAILQCISKSVSAKPKPTIVSIENSSSLLKIPPSPMQITPPAIINSKDVKLEALDNQHENSGATITAKSTECIESNESLMIFPDQSQSQESPVEMDAM